MRACSFLLVAMTLFVSGCSRFSPSETSSSQVANTPSNSNPNPNGVDSLSKIVFSREIAPLMVTNCTTCHRSQGGIAPFPLETYNDFVSHKVGIRKALVARTMPPPGIDNSGDCQSFSNAKWLSAKDLDTFVSWIDDGAPQGDPNFKPQIPVASGGMSEPKTVLKIPTPYTPAPAAGKLDDYRCFIVDPKTTAETMITSVDVLPEQPKIVHHVIVFKPTSEAAQATAMTMDGSDGRPGYPCFGAAGVPSTVIGLWAPGQTSAEMKDPETGGLLGLRLEAGRKLIVQVHYNTANGVMQDQTAIAIKTTSQAKMVKWTVLANFKLDLPPGQSDVVATMTQTNMGLLAIDHLYESGTVDSVIAGQGLSFSTDLVLAALGSPLPRELKIYAVAPHMHTLGRSLKVEMIDSSNQNSCMANVPLFDFNWQSGFYYRKSLTLGVTSSVKITCGFDTTGRTEAVKFAEGTQDEMCLAFLLVSEK